MAITWPSREDLVDRFLEFYKVFFPNAVKSKGTDPWREAQAWGGVGGILIARLKQIYADMLITTATGTALDAHAAAWLPEGRRRQVASGTTDGSIRITGTAADISLNTELVNAAGVRYRTSVNTTVADWGGLGWVNVDVLSVDTGQVCNMLAGETMDFVSPIAGVDSDASVVGGDPLVGARDDETNDELRARLVAWMQDPPGGGNWPHYMHYAQGTGGCEKAYVYPNYRAVGTVDVVCLGPGVDDDNPTGDRFTVDVDAVWDEIDEEVRPCTADIDVAGGSAITVATAQVRNVEITVVVNDGYELDCTALNKALALDLGNTRIQVNADPAGDYDQYDRILLNVHDGSVWIPEIRQVESTTSGPPHYITVTEAFSGATPDPDANGVMPAGPGTQEQVDAILDLFDRLTPGDTSPATRRPVPGSEHPTDLNLADIFDAVQSLPSVQNMTITTPVADVTPTTEKYLIRNGKVFIR